MRALASCALAAAIVMSGCEARATSVGPASSTVGKGSGIGLAATPSKGPLVTSPTFTWRNAHAAINSSFTLGANYMGFAEMGIAGETSALRNVEYQLAQNSGIGVASTWFGYDWVCSSYPTGCYTWGSSKFLAFVTWVQEMQRRGIKVWIKIGWTFSNDICGPPTTSCSPSASDLATYSQVGSAVLGKLLNDYGLSNITGAQLFTEPSGASYYATMATSLRAQIAADDASRTPVLPRIEITGANEESQNAPPPMLSYMRANADAQFDAYSWHFYCFTPQFGPLGLSANNCADRSGVASLDAIVVSLASPKALTVDEGGYLGHGTGNATGLDEYRQTGDMGILLARTLDAHAWADVHVWLPWMMQDQWWPPFVGNPAYHQHYGIWGRWVGQTIDVPQSWFPMAMLGRLAIGRDGSTVNDATGSSSTLHPTGYTIPGGGLAFALVNEGAARSVSWAFESPLARSRTFYRYVYSAESPRFSRPDKPAYLPAWDIKQTVTSGFLASVVPGHSVVIWSTLNTGGAAAVNLLLGSAATASATSSGAAANLTDGNDTHVTGAANVWQPSGTGATVDLPFPSGAGTINRIDVDMVGTMAPYVWADYSTSAAPAPPDQYTLQQWDGAAWQTLVAVTSNSQIHRTHTFSPIATSKIRLIVPNAPSAPFTEIQASRDTRDLALGLFGYTAGTGESGQITEHTIANVSYVLQAGDTVEYDVLLLDKAQYDLTAKPGIGGLDVVIDGGCSSTELRSVSGYQDQNGVSGALSSDLSSYAYATWFRRVMTVPACAVGHTVTAVAIGQERNDYAAGATNYGSMGTAFYDNVAIKHADGSMALSVYSDGAPSTVETLHSSGFQTGAIFVAPKG